MQEPDDTGTNGFKVSGSTIIFSTAPATSVPFWAMFQGNVVDVGVPSAGSVSEVKLNVSNSPTNGYVLTAQSATSGGLTWAADSTSDSTKLPLAGGTMTGNLNLGDNVKALFGSVSGDLQIYHDGSNSYIYDAGTGTLNIRASSAINLQTPGGAASLATFSENGANTFYYSGSAKLATTSTGVQVTGEVLSSTGVFGLDGGDKMSFANNSHIDWNISNATEMRLEADGDLHVDGNVTAYSTTISDERLKENIQPIEDALSKVSQLKGCTFTYTADGRESAGLIAQDVEKVLPSAVIETKLPLKIDDGNEYKVLQYDQTIGLLVEAIKELSAKVEELSSKVE
jgi:hypothetical protein